MEHYFRPSHTPIFAALRSRKGKNPLNPLEHSEDDNLIDLLERVYLNIGHDTGNIIPVNKEVAPGLRALIRNQFPDLAKKPHVRAKIEAETARFAGSILNPYFEKVKGIEDYANAVNYLSKNEPRVKKLLDVTRESVEIQDQVEGAQGFRSFPSSEGNVGQSAGVTEGYAGKITLASRFIQPGSQAVDTTIQKKVESVVSGDLFNFYAPNPENGMYNGMFLNDAQWEKDIHFKEPLNLPRSGDDQLYFPSWRLNSKYENEQPVLMELEDMYQDKLYAIYAAHDEKIDFLRDKQLQIDPIFNQERFSYMVPSITLQGDNQGRSKEGTWKPYPDPEQPRSSAFVNYVGFKPEADTWRNPSESTRFEPIDLAFPPRSALQLVETNGFQDYCLGQ